MRAATVLLLVGLATAACSSDSAAARESSPPDASQAGTGAAARTIPITTRSPQAREHFLRAVELRANVRMPEAAQELEQALKLDPDFVQARALHGEAQGGAEGLAEIERAAAQAGSVPEPERLLIIGIAEARRGERAKAMATWRRLADMAPDDWRAFDLLGHALHADQKYAEAAQAFRRVTQLNPQAGSGYNMLGYALLEQGELEGAIEAFEQYVATAPREANAHDSLAEALMTTGRFSESEAAFRKALELDPAFSPGWEGVAYTKFYRGDWAGGREALAKAASTATRLIDRINVQRFLAVAALAEGKPADAVRALEAARDLPGMQPADAAFLDVQRARTLTEAGRPREALPLLDSAVERASAAGVPPGLARNIQGQALVARAAAQAALNEVQPLMATVGALEAQAKERPDAPAAQSAAQFGRGLAATAKGDHDGARAAFSQCASFDIYCRYRLVLSAEKAGDAAGAAAARESLLRTYERDFIHLLVRSRLQSGT